MRDSEEKTYLSTLSQRGTKWHKSSQSCRRSQWITENEMKECEVLHKRLFFLQSFASSPSYSFYNIHRRIDTRKIWRMRQLQMYIER